MTDKSVLVIDMPEEYRTEDVLVDYCLHTKGEYKVIRKSGNHPLKPLPEKAAVDESMLGIGFDDFNTIYYLGFNECIDKITGETE